MRCRFLLQDAQAWAEGCAGCARTASNSAVSVHLAAFARPSIICEASCGCRPRLRCNDHTKSAFADYRRGCGRGGSARSRPRVGNRSGRDLKPRGVCEAFRRCCCDFSGRCKVAGMIHDVRPSDRPAVDRASSTDPSVAAITLCRNQTWRGGDLRMTSRGTRERAAISRRGYTGGSAGVVGSVGAPG